MKNIYKKTYECIELEKKLDDTIDELDEMISQKIKDKTELDIEVRTYFDYDNVYFEIQNMTVEEIKIVKEKIEKATETSYKMNYCFFFSENKL